RSDCYSPTKLLHESTRFAVSLFGLKGTTGDVGRALETAMHEQGWDRKWYACPSWGGCAYHSTPWSHRPGHLLEPVLGIVRYRISARLGTAVMVSTSVSGSTLGLDTATSVNAQIEVTWSEHFMGALMTYDWKGVQFGVGAAVQSTKL